MKICKKNSNKKKIFLWIMCVISVCGIFLGCVWLFYNESITQNDLFKSDFKAHIKSARNGNGYSMMGQIFHYALRICDDTMVCAVILAVIVVLTIFATGRLLMYMLEKADVHVQGVQIYLIATVFLFLCSIYLPELHPFFYRNTANTQPWHNSTYILMRLFSILVILYYFKIEENYLVHISIKDWMLFSLCLLLVNWSKPSFIIGFAPVMLFYLIRDFLQRRGKGTVQMIKFGMAVLVSLPICVMQAKKLWPAETIEEKGILFTFENIVEFVNSPKSVWYIICGLIFPIAVGVISIIKKNKSRILSATWFMYMVAWMEYLFLEEYGRRANHGNFGWSRKIFAYFLYMSALVETMKLYKKGDVSKPVFVGLISIFALNVLSGMVYFLYLLMGHTYFF